MNALWEHYRDLQPRAGDEAEAFYKTEIWPPMFAAWQAATPEEKLPHFAVSVHTLGDSPEVVALAASRLAATDVVVLYSQRTKRYLNWLEQQLGRRVDGAEVDANNTTDIYREVQQIVRRHAGQRLAFDSTGGTKAMVAGLSAAAFTLSGRGFDVCVFYIEVRRELTTQLPRPIPGSERLVELTNPLEMFGELDYEGAKARYAGGDFEGAAGAFGAIAERTGDEARYRPFALLARAYALWYANNFTAARQRFVELIQFLEKPGLREHELRAGLTTVRRQLVGLKLLEPLSTAYENAELRLATLADAPTVGWLLASLEVMQALFVRAGNFTAAGLLCYRGLEVATQHRLARYAFDTLAADYSTLPLNYPALEQRYAEAWHKVTSKAQAKTARVLLPAGQPLPLLEGFMLLTALDDKLAHALLPQRLMGLAELRNGSLWTHGYKPIEEKKYSKLYELFTAAREALLDVEGGSYTASAITLP